MTVRPQTSPPPSPADPAPRHRPARTRRPARQAVLVTATAVLAATTLAAAPAHSRTTPHTTALDLVLRGERLAATRAARAGVRWHACPKGWDLPAPIECGYVTVPVDYAKPNGPTIRLAVDRARSTGPAASRQGALVYNPGGPGGSGLSFPRRTTSHSTLWAAAAAAYDFVGFDPRGVGHSAAISCQDPAEFTRVPKPDPVPRDEAAKSALRAAARAYADSCLRRGGRLLPHLTTPDLARDLDVIRAALGERRLNYLGVSYGTYLGAVYATLFPAHVRRMIVDSVVDPDPAAIWYRDNLDQDVAFQDRWADWEAWVARNDAAYHLGTTVAEVERAWQRLRASAAAHPIGGVVGPAELLAFFQNAPYYDQYWPVVADVWSAYAAGDSRPLIDNASPDPDDHASAREAENGNAVYTAVECGDAHWPRDWRVWDADSVRLHANHPFLTWSNTWMNLPCATWGGPQRTPVDVRSHEGLPRVLIVQSTRDAATPYAGAVELHRRLKGSELLTERDAGSHGVTGLVNPCVNDRVTAYLLRGALDASDTTCGPHDTPRPQVGRTSTVQPPRDRAGDPAGTGERATYRVVVPDLPGKH
jgi:pimeloyl-ACP methyl ester carboxylesterase